MFKFVLTTLALGGIAAYGLGFVLSYLGIVSVGVVATLGTFLGLAIGAFYMVPAWSSMLGIKSIIGGTNTKVS